MISLNGNNLNPLYLQLKQKIVDDINNGKYKHGDQLPTETELCEMYGISRVTIRRAISGLVAEGILYRIRGKGTFITGDKLKNELFDVSGFSEFSVDKQHSYRILSTSIVPANDYFASILQISPEDHLLRLERLLYVEEEPLFIDISYYPSKRFPDFEKFIGESVSTYKILKDKYNKVPDSNERLIDVVFAQKEEAELLKVDVGATLYKIEKTVYDNNDIPIHISILRLPTNRVKLSVKRNYKKLL
jgi:GntR family transcriptional regulator, frlABCD operon transcriptional regulator